MYSCTLNVADLSMLFFWDLCELEAACYVCRWQVRESQYPYLVLDALVPLSTRDPQSLKKFEDELLIIDTGA